MSIIDLIKYPIRPIYLYLNKITFEYRYRRNCFKDNLGIAFKIVKEKAIANGDKLISVYRSDLKLYQYTFIEWYYLYKLNIERGGSKKSRVISVLEAQRYYRKFIDNYHRYLFTNKSKFLETFKPYIKRETLDCSDTQVTPEIFSKKFQDKNLIVKPLFGTLGRGIFKIFYTDIIKNQGTESFLKEAQQKKYLIEECIEANEEIQSFHPLSLNTIRVVTCIDSGAYRIFGAVIRFGVGESIIDNVHTGGLYASINLETGIIDSNALNAYGEEFEEHPDSRKKFMGFQIPKWEQIKTECLNAHKFVKTPIIGWDVCINKESEVEFIEGNHAPDMDLLQVPHQRELKEDFIRIVTRKQ